MQLFLNLLILCATAWREDYDIPSVVSLTPSNHVSLVGSVTEHSVAKWSKQLARCDADIVYVYINSPGGSVSAGNTFIQAIDYHATSGKKIACIADFAASMAFAILQACPYRLSTSHSIVMQHQMSLLLAGPLGNVKNRVGFAISIEESMNEMQANRLGLTLGGFEEKVQNDWWIYGSNILRENAADQLITVGCNSVLEASPSACPLNSLDAHVQQEALARVDPMFELWLEHRSV
jgi:ATP-dependent protease ClpP protease subunit